MGVFLHVTSNNYLHYISASLKIDIEQLGMIDQPLARLAQSVERETLKEFLRNLKVVGSTPTSGSIPVVPSIFFGESFFSSPVLMVISWLL